MPGLLIIVPIDDAVRHFKWMSTLLLLLFFYLLFFLLLYRWNELDLLP